LLKISNLQASNVADAINVTLPRALDGALNAIIPFLDVEAIVAEIVSMAVLIQKNQLIWILYLILKTMMNLMNKIKLKIHSKWTIFFTFIIMCVANNLMVLYIH